MKTGLDFADILDYFDEENAATDAPPSKHTSHATSINAGWETVLDPASLAFINPTNLGFLVGQVSVYTSVTSTPYKKFKSNYQRPAHLFNDEQSSAFATISHWVPELKSNFSYKQLKSSYRLALLKTHPDQGGSSENFWAVKKSYEVLCSLVKS